MTADVKTTIWHNPNCGTSRKALEMLRGAGADVTAVDYLETPPTELTHDGDGVGDAEILDAMVAHPILIERPLVETSRGVRLARPAEAVYEIL